MNTAKEAAVSAVKEWIDWAGRSINGPRPLKAETIPYSYIVDSVIAAYAEALVPDDNGWFPIASLPEGQHVQLYWREGERGVGGIECAMVFFNDSDDWSYWTHGGPNSGIDWYPVNNEKPTHWRPQPPPPKPLTRE